MYWDFSNFTDASRLARRFYNITSFSLRIHVTRFHDHERNTDRLADLDEAATLATDHFRNTDLIQAIYVIHPEYLMRILIWGIDLTFTLLTYFILK